MSPQDILTTFIEDYAMILAFLWAPGVYVAVRTLFVLFHPFEKAYVDYKETPEEGYLALLGKHFLPSSVIPAIASATALVIVFYGSLPIFAAVFAISIIHASLDILVTLITETLPAAPKKVEELKIRKVAFRRQWENFIRIQDA